jgi:FkbM family methyltransferase
MNSFFQKLKFYKDCLIGKNCYFPVQIKMKTQWAGNQYGGFFIIPELLSEKSIVYSFGIGEDISFDEYLMNKYNCNIYAYDPTPKSKVFIQNNKMSPLFHFFDTGIADYDGISKFYLPENDEFVSCTTYNRWGYDEQEIKPVEVNVKRLLSLMEDNNHKEIDLLKMDIEGSEYAVIKDIINSDIPIKQICLEVHHHFKGIGIKKTKEMVEALNKAGFMIAAISQTKEEYTFLRK